MGMITKQVKNLNELTSEQIAQVIKIFEQKNDKVFIDDLNTIVNGSYFVCSFINDLIIGVGRLITDGKAAYLHDIYIVDAFVNFGIGKKILTVLLNLAKENRIGWIGVICQNAELYNGIGFKKIAGTPVFID